MNSWGHEQSVREKINRAPDCVVYTSQQLDEYYVSRTYHLEERHVLTLVAELGVSVLVSVILDNVRPRRGADRGGGGDLAGAAEEQLEVVGCAAPIPLRA